MELSLDLSLAFVPRTISELLSNVSAEIKDGSYKMAMLDYYVKRLEDEMRKIEAFKRELPHCMLLVNQAITILKEEIDHCMKMQNQPVEDFMPLKVKYNSGRKGSLTIGKETCDKKNWMSSVQLWSDETKLGTEEGSMPKNKTNSEGAFIAYNGNSLTQKTVMKRDNKEVSVSQAPRLSLLTPMFEMNHENSNSGCGGSSDSSFVTSLVEIKGRQPQPQQNPRKQRRCWSKELHRSFVDALQQLGGTQVATPKQIRELMQVEGLTNDEVKSHLQKYRLHVKRLPVSSVGQANNDLWIAQDQYGEKSKGNFSSQSGSPQGPLTLRGYAKCLSSSGLKSSDAEEDVQSDCHSWKTGLHQYPEHDAL
ncbi:hypothetical protein TanjilG_21021 [Lupinus angustifolius]|uniref:HTH myb-type domain-containing protein n=1 Tax=Lupinus angustifolius TaxID=3871 RepID=A0A1J7GV29_LUPAN|nr:PREDICTED: myb family transcription factor EFM-like [Lupinus angustifolius]OIV93460.1 hypothetical protein TanjilG_21021 [Lupinus angustifolius]